MLSLILILEFLLRSKPKMPRIILMLILMVMPTRLLQMLKGATQMHKLEPQPSKIKVLRLSIPILTRTELES